MCQPKSESPSQHLADSYYGVPQGTFQRRELFVLKSPMFIFHLISEDISDRKDILGVALSQRQTLNEYFFNQMIFIYIKTIQG